MTLSKRELENNASNKAVEYSLFMKFYGFRKKKCLNAILEDSKLKYGPKTRSLEVRKSHWSGFEAICKLKKRTRETIYSDKLDQITTYLDSFLESREDYEKRGIPYRTGILLHGVPGTGKSTINQFIANYLKRDLNLLNLKSESSMSEMFANDDLLIVIEDIDCAGISVRERDTEDNSSGLVKESSVGPTLSDILNAIDGVTTGQNLIFIFTTNHKDKLDAALLRPGRVDLDIELGYMNQNEFTMACQNLFEKDPTKEVKQGVTPAKLQQVYLNNKKDFDSFEELLTE